MDKLEITLLKTQVSLLSAAMHAVLAVQSPDAAAAAHETFQDLSTALREVLVCSTRSEEALAAFDGLSESLADAMFQAVDRGE